MIAGNSVELQNKISLTFSVSKPGHDQDKEITLCRN